MNEHTLVPTQLARHLDVVVIIKWMLIASIVIFGITDADPNDRTDGEQADSAYMNSESKIEENVFNEAKDEIWMARMGRDSRTRKFNATHAIIKREVTAAVRLTTDKDVDFRRTSKDKIIIDKTRFITKLSSDENERGQFIMLRPYRFGKSFFLTTLAAFFEGKKYLFCNRLEKPMDICNDRQWGWEEYPILYMDFGLVPGSLTDYIKTKVLTLASDYEIFNINEKATFDTVMERAFMSIQQKTGKKIVILVDEYDLIVMEKYFDDVALSKLREDEIRSFFHALKLNADLIQFAFVFGATKVTTIGDTYNVFQDLTRNDTYSELIGFTEHEIKEYYKDQLVKITCERKLKNSDVLIEEIVKPFYNYYKFTKKGVPVFSPVSITNFLRENPEQPKSYWAEKVQLRPLLENTVQKFSKTALDILFEDTLEVDMDFLNAKIDRQKVADGDSSELAKILFQAGFMSIKKNEVCSTNGTLPSCFLGVVNEEAKNILDKSLRQKMAKGPVTVRKMETLLRDRQLTNFMGALDYAIEWLTGDKFFRLETKYQRAIAFILELKKLTVQGSLSAFVESSLYTEFEIEKNFMDYNKQLPNLNVMFYLKKQDQDQNYVDFIEETMKCLGTYAKPYGKKHENDEVLYVIISAYAATEEGMPLVNTLKRNLTGLKFIHNWAAVEWFPKTETIKTYNLGLDGSDNRTKHRLEVITQYKETDQRITPPYLVPASFDLIADQIIQVYTKVISLEKFYEFIELCVKPQTDAPKHVSKFTSDIQGLIKLVEECLIKVSYMDDRVLYFRLKNIIQALKKM